MKIAVFSDIHGNLVSFEKILLDLKNETPDLVIFLGDLATLCPKPKATVDILKSLNCISVLGNHDEYMFDPDKVKKYTNEKVILDSIDWCRDELSSADIEFIKNFPTEYNINLNDKLKLFCFHGSPTANIDVILAENVVEKLAGYFDENHKTIFINGHTHIQMYNRYQDNIFLNPGSVGQPFAEYNHKGPPQILPQVEYALVELIKNDTIVSMKRLSIDIKLMRDSLNSVDFPLKNWLLTQYKE